MDHPLTAILVSNGGPLQVRTVTKTIQTMREFKDSEVIQFLKEWLWIFVLDCTEETKYVKKFIISLLTVHIREMKVVN
jgi:hypothetical protein